MMRLVILLALPLAACAGVQSPLAPAGDQAAALHRLLILMTVVCGAIYAMVAAGIGWSLWRARRADAAPEAQDDPRLNRTMFGAAAIIVAGLAVLITGSFLADRALFADRGREALTVRVTGHQWWWRIEYRVGDRWVETANELHLPLDRPARVLLGSADVIHSFWVPNVAGKIDMVPGRRNQLDITPRRTGWFRGQCAEFCGLQHAHMALDVRVEPPAEFTRWLSAQAAPAARADRPFPAACAACHTIRGTAARGRAGPDLTHLASRRSIAAGTLPMSRGGLQGWIAQPQALKPGTAMPTVPLSPAEANAVASYLAGLR